MKTIKTSTSRILMNPVYVLSYVGPGPSNDLFKLPEGRPVTALHKSVPKYELATHTVKVRRTGALQEVMAIWDLQGTVRVLKLA